MVKYKPLQLQEVLIMFANHSSATRNGIITICLLALTFTAAPALAAATRAPSAGLISALAAFLVLGSNVVVQAVTLPVELDASFKKALPLLQSGYLTERQQTGARRILRAAALTYLASSLAGLLNFWQWLRVLRR